MAYAATSAAALDDEGRDPTPERNLWVAVLHTARDDSLGGNQRWRNDARAFWQTERCAADAICNALDLERSALAAALAKQWRDPAPPEDPPMTTTAETTTNGVTRPPGEPLMRSATRLTSGEPPTHCPGVPGTVRADCGAAFEQRSYMGGRPRVRCPDCQALHKTRKRRETLAAREGRTITPRPAQEPPPLKIGPKQPPPASSRSAITREVAKPEPPPRAARSRSPVLAELAAARRTLRDQITALEQRDAKLAQAESVLAELL